MRLRKFSKILAGLLLTTSITSASVPAMASENPYETVQEDDWSYIAVNDLIEHGLIDSRDEPLSGYINRNGIAEYIAQAMSNYDSAEPEQRGEIDRLKMAYAEELRVMGVKLNAGLAEVFMPTSALHVFGKFKAYYDWERTSDTGRSTGLSYRLALNVTGKLDKHWSYEGGFVSGTDSIHGQGFGFGIVDNARDASNSAVRLGSAALRAHNILGADQVVVGYQWIGPDNDNFVYSNGLKGIQLYYNLGKVNATFKTGYLDLGRMNTSSPNAYIYGWPYDNERIMTVGLNTNLGKTYVGGVYYRVHNDNKADTTEFWNGQVKFPIAKNFYTNINVGGSTDDKENHFHDIKINYKEADFSKVGSYTAYLDYHRIGRYSIIDPAEETGFAVWSDLNGSGLKGLKLGVEFVPFKNTLWYNYLMPKNKAVTGDAHTTLFRSMFISYF